MSKEEIANAVKLMDTLVEIRDLLKAIDDKLEDLKFITGAQKMQ